ncbi:hypothetical protein LWI28_006693 [Acer negundo]|uniref:Uncharacterized protein n=1 Tax=Acer negundo TaxID=4023 RepID=A0AAD5IDC4_ACENE|nr:hypothetical protein LWI28_006693 [Acer negundo]
MRSIHRISFVHSAENLRSRTGDALHQELESTAGGDESRRRGWSAWRGWRRGAGGTQWKRDSAAGEIWERRSTWRRLRGGVGGGVVESPKSCSFSTSPISRSTQLLEPQPLRRRIISPPVAAAVGSGFSLSRLIQSYLWVLFGCNSYVNS